MTQLQLPGDRRLDVQVSGADDGPVVLFHHGTPGSKVPFRVMEQAVLDLGGRFVTYSRPGYGRSTRRPGRSVADIASDMEHLLDHLGAEKCVTAGWSGGGPHALATGALLGDRVTGVLSIAGVAPYDGDGLEWLAGMGEDNVAEFGNALAGEERLHDFLEAGRRELANVNTAKLITEMATLLPQVDRDALNAAYGDDLTANFAEALRESADGWMDDDLAFIRPWRFGLELLDMPVFVWQGSADLMVPFGHGEWLAEHIATSVPHLFDGQGHLSIALGHTREMFEELLATLD